MTRVSMLRVSLIRVSMVCGNLRLPSSDHRLGGDELRAFRRDDDASGGSAL